MAAGGRYAVRLGLGVILALASLAGCGNSTVSPSSSTEARYEDGIPRVWDGQPVLRGQAAIDRADASTDDSPFLIAVWAGLDQARSCPGVNEEEVGLTYCNTLKNAGDQPGMPSEIAGRMRMDLNAYAPGPLILRVHTHDETLMHCSASNAVYCEHGMVLEAVLWRGDAMTAPRPTSVEQAAAAFGLPTKLWRYDPLCSGLGFTGAPVLGPADGKRDEIVVAVFPSAASLAAMTRVAAGGGEMAVIPFQHDCVVHTEQQGRQVTLRVRWMARGNVLVGVMYDDSTNPETDPTVVQARAALAQLPAS